MKWVWLFVVFSCLLVPALSHSQGAAEFDQLLGEAETLASRICRMGYPHNEAAQKLKSSTVIALARQAARYNNPTSPQKIRCLMALEAFEAYLEECANNKKPLPAVRD